jgi:two-component system response regulator
MPHKVDILLVEDNANDAELTIRALRRNKLVNNIQVVEDGVEALDLIFCRGSHQDETFSHPPRLVLLDLKLPRVGGLEVLRAIRADERTKAIPVVIFTSSKEERDLLDSYKLGVNAYAQKPIDFEQFSEIVRQIGMFWMLINQPPPPAAFLASTTHGA